MKRLSVRALSSVLSLAMVLSVFPMEALAAQDAWETDAQPSLFNAAPAPSPLWSSKAAADNFPLAYVADGNGGTWYANWDAEGTEPGIFVLKLSENAETINRVTFTGHYNWLIHKVNLYAFDQLPQGCNGEQDWSGVTFTDPVASDVTLSWNGNTGAQSASDDSAVVTLPDTQAMYLAVEVLEGRAFDNGSTSYQYSVGEVSADYEIAEPEYPEHHPSSTNASNRIGQAVWGTGSTADSTYCTAATDINMQTSYVTEQGGKLVLKLGEAPVTVTDLRLSGYDTWRPTALQLYAFDQVPQGVSGDDWSGADLGEPFLTADELSWEYLDYGAAAASCKVVFDQPVTAQYIAVVITNSTDGSESSTQNTSVREISFGRQDTQETSSDWYLDSKYELMVTYAFSDYTTNGVAYPLTRSAGGQLPSSIDQLADGLNVEKFAADCKKFGFDTVCFSAWHASMNANYPSLVMQSWRGEGHSSNRDLIGEVIQALKAEGLNVMLYVHPSDGHDMTAADQAALGWKDPNTVSDPAAEVPKWNDFVNAMFEEIGERYGKDIDGYWFDGGGQNIDRTRLQETLEQYNPDAVYYWGTDRTHYDPNNPATWIDNWVLRGRNEAVFFGSSWWTNTSWDWDGRRFGDRTAEYLYKYTVAMGATQSSETTECGLPSVANVQWGASPYMGSDNPWERNVEEELLEVAAMMAEVEGSISGTRPSESFVTREGDTITSRGGTVATETPDGKTTFIHVLIPPTDGSKTIQLGVPEDGKQFSRAWIYNKNEDGGKEVAIAADPITGAVTLTLPEDAQWDGYHTVIAMEFSDYGVLPQMPVNFYDTAASILGVTSSAYGELGFTMKSLIDGNISDNNGWHSADSDTDAYVTVDLGQSYYVSAATLAPRAGSTTYLPRFPAECDVYVSDTAPVYENGGISGIVETDLAASATLTSNGSSAIIPFAKQVQGRYVTLHVKSVNGGNCINLSELSLTLFAENQNMPGAPTQLAAEAGDGSVTLTWQAPDSAGSSAIETYQVRCGEDDWINVADTSYTFTNLENGTAYTFAVRAKNESYYGRTAEITATPKADESINTGGGTAATPSYTITVTQATGGKISPSTTSVTKGSDKTFTITADEGYKISDVLVDGKSVGAVSTYTFEDVTAQHTITAKFEKTEEITNVGDFTDVKSTDWFAEAVQYAVDEGLMNGTSGTTFSPNGATTRAMIVTILYRQAGSPAVESDGKTWWSDAQAWAMANGISDGTNMDKEITREQLATMLYRYAALTGRDVSQSTELDDFQDASQISGYAMEALEWAAAEGIVTGKTGGVIDPQAGATRAETATMFMRFIEAN